MKTEQKRAPIGVSIGNRFGGKKPFDEVEDMKTSSEALKFSQEISKDAQKSHDFEIRDGVEDGTLIGWHLPEKQPSHRTSLPNPIDNSKKQSLS